jgi:hypothetical protein
MKRKKPYSLHVGIEEEFDWDNFTVDQLAKLLGLGEGCEIVESGNDLDELLKKYPKARVISRLPKEKYQV